MISLNIKWFFGLSVAAHAAALVAWQAPSLTAGNSGRILQLSVSQQAGSTAAQSVSAGSVEIQPQLEREPRPAKPIDNTISKQTSVQKPVARGKSARPEPVIPVNNQPDNVLANTASSPVMQQHDSGRHLRDSVMALITQELSYPAIARRKGWQGIVTIELHIEADGSISSLQLDESSGYAVLDTAAMQCLRTARVPDATQWLHGKAVDLIVPVEYRLTGG